MTAATHPPAAPAGLGRPSAAGPLDVVVSDLVRVRLLDATPTDRAAVEAQLGPAGEASSTVPADLTVRYVERVPVPRGMRLLGPGEVGVDDGALIVLRGRFRRPTRVRIPLASVLEGDELLCEHGVGRVPHLIALVNLAVLERGGVALHASAVEHDGAAVVATGWAKGGKTEAVLALAETGARLVGDEWVHLHPDGTVRGIREPLRLWDWQRRQLPRLRAATRTRDRARLGVLAAGVTVSRRSSRISTALDRQRFTDLDGADLGRWEGPPLPRGPVLLMTSAERTDVEARRVAGREVADRMVASLDEERRPLHELTAAHRFAFPGRALVALDQAGERERAALHLHLDDAPAHEVLHPHPVDLAELGAVIRRTLGALP